MDVAQLHGDIEVSYRDLRNLARAHSIVCVREVTVAAATYDGDHAVVEGFHRALERDRDQLLYHRFYQALDARPEDPPRLLLPIAPHFVNCSPLLPTSSPPRGGAIIVNIIIRPK
ncbi:unnamed protein product, partial [Trichogramma brassicae]